MGECENEDNSPRPSCPCTVFANCLHQNINSLGLQCWRSSEQPLFLDLGLGARLRPGVRWNIWCALKCVWCQCHLLQSANTRPTTSSDNATQFAAKFKSYFNMVFNEISSWGPGNYGLKTQIPNENGYFSVLCSAFKQHRLATKKTYIRNKSRTKFDFLLSRCFDLPSIHLRSLYSAADCATYQCLLDNLLFHSL